MRFIAFLLLLLNVHLVAAQTDVEVSGSGETGTITYGETVTGELEVSEASDIQSISFVGHNGQNRRQGDFDVWYFDAQKGDDLIIRMTATDGDFAPTLLITYEEKTSFNSMVGVVNLDANYGEDGEAGACLRDVPQNNQYAIVAYRTQPIQGSYSLSLEKVDSPEALSGGSDTAWCSVGTFVYTREDFAVNIRSGPSKTFSIKAKMQPGQPYNFYSFGEDWTQITYQTPDGLGGGYVSTPLVRITNTMVDNADETPEPSG